jgi:DNA-binding SARP family transcriptional activator
VLGRLRVTLDGEFVPVTRRQAVLLALMAANTDGIARDVACQLLWPNASPAVARNALKQLVFQTRRRIGVPAAMLSGLQLSLDEAHVTVDAWDALAAARAKTWGRACDLLVGKYAEHVEDAPDSPLMHWLGEVRDRYQRLRCDALRRAAEAAEADGLWGDAAEYWWRLSVQLPDDPLVQARRTNANARSLRLLG